MADIHRQARVPHSAEKMYDLVNDIASYPLFLPWCKAARVNEIDKRIVVYSYRRYAATT
ncbi:MAG: hypothetical protein K2Q33_08970, partial [Gammaproteobacteria bacterium]|nr:hypothetical protein [Gammaproteobacteria bacterium]